MPKIRLLPSNTLKYSCNFLSKILLNYCQKKKEQVVLSYKSDTGSGALAEILHPCRQWYIYVLHT